MANPEHVRKAKNGGMAWNAWWREKEPTLVMLRIDARFAELTHISLASPPQERADLRGANLNGVNLTGAFLYYADLRCAKLIKATLRNAILSEADLSGADLEEAEMRSSELFRANLSGANLPRAILWHAELVEANLSFANLCSSKLSSANLEGADLHGADLHGADLHNANLSHAKLSEVDLTAAQLGSTIFVDTDLSQVIGLETVIHYGPSSLGSETLYKSQGEIPEEFMRGCGLSDWEIEAAKLYNPKLTLSDIAVIKDRIFQLRANSRIQFYSCFISYSSKDHEFAERLHDDLQGEGVRCWFAPEDMKIGGRIRPTIDHEIRLHDKLLLVLSEHSISSDWVEKEVETAFEEERRRKTTILFPIRLDSAVMDTDQAWAADIRRTRHIGDFTNWKDHDAYQKAFDRLLRDLKAEGAETQEDVKSQDA